MVPYCLILGAGMHKKSKHKRYNKLARAASKAGAEKLKAGATALEAVKSAVMGRHILQ